jgi:hypothetical protein
MTAASALRLAALHGLLGMALPAMAADACRATTGPRAATVVELYTSQGCSSCPPADAWLGRLKAEPGVVPLAFHVDYWDNLGWKDRYASRANTDRQASERKVNGARQSYTPQVVVDGLDRPDWAQAAVGAKAPPRASTVEATLVRDGDRVVATIGPRGTSAPRRLAAVWAVTEHGHATAVRAGENRGATLGNDAVVRRWEAVEAWKADARAPRQLAFQAPVAPAASRQSVVLVVLDPSTGRPVDAVSLGC